MKFIGIILMFCSVASAQLISRSELLFRLGTNSAAWKAAMAASGTGVTNELRKMQYGSIALSNLLAQGYTNIMGDTNITMWLSNGTLRIASTASGIQNTNTLPVFSSTNVLSENLRADTFTAGVLILSNVSFAATAVKAIDGNVADQWLQTNRLSAATSIIFTNHSVGQMTQVIIRGELSGGSDRNISVIVPPGDLIQDGRSAYATTLTVVATNGVKWEFMAQKQSVSSTNVWVVDRTWRLD